MVITWKHKMPTYEELDVPEINLSSVLFHAAAMHLGRVCEPEYNEFMLCRDEYDDPRKCVYAGKDVTSCSLKLFQHVKKYCSMEFQRYVTCLEDSSYDTSFVPCRRTQAYFDKCMLDKVNVERLPADYYVRPHVHKTDRPRPQKPKEHYIGVPQELPDDAPRPPAKFGNRMPPTLYGG